MAGRLDGRTAGRHQGGDEPAVPCDVQRGQRLAEGRLAALTGDLSAVEMMREAFDRRRLTIVGMLNEIPGVTCPVPEGAFYAYPACAGCLVARSVAVSPRPPPSSPRSSLDEAEVAVVPGEAFGTQGYLRLSITPSATRTSLKVCNGSRTCSASRTG